MNIKVKKCDIETNFFCNICNKFYASQNSLCNHNKKFHHNYVLINSNITPNKSENILINSENIKNNIIVENVIKYFII